MKVGMTQSHDRTLGKEAAGWATEIEAWPDDYDESRGFLEDFGADDVKAEITASGTLTSAYVVIQPSSPRVQFEPYVGTVTLFENGDRLTTHVGPCAARNQMCDYLAHHFDGVEVDT